MIKSAIKLLVALLAYSNISFAGLKSQSDSTNRQLVLNDACEMALQGKVAYDKKGMKEWADSQIKNLCGTAINSTQPAICFSAIMQNETPQGNDLKWEWYNAIQLCKQTLNSQETLNCYFDEVKTQGPKQWKNIIASCNAIVSTAPIIIPVALEVPAPTKVAPAVHIEKKSVIHKTIKQKSVAITAPIKKTLISSRCVEALQGKVAWDYKGSKNWNVINLNRLCKGVEDSIEPSVCVAKVMHGGISWGGGTQWKWGNALHLCEGTKNAATAVSCFKNKIKSGHTWKPAIAACHNVGVVSAAPAS